MRNKRLIVLAALLCAALATAGISMAMVKSGGVSGIAATFDATTIVRDVQKSCTVNGGDTYTYTRAVYTGNAASSDPRMNGPIKLWVQSMIDDTTGIGALIGDFNIGTNKSGSYGRIEASIAGDQASGSVRGHVRLPWGELFAGLGGTFTPAGGFSAGSIGAGDGTQSGVVLSKGACVHVIYLH
jgi:hypothetical protein